MTDEKGTYYTRHDMSEEGLAVTITLLLAEIANVDPEEIIDNFGLYVDPDALDQLFPRESPDDGIDHAVLELTIKDHYVSVYSDGFIFVEA